MERATRRRRDHARRLAGDRQQRLLVDVHSSEAVHQADRVRMARRVEDREHVRELDDAAGVHHDHAVGELGDQPEVVGDQDRRGVRLALSGLQHLDDLRLDRHVERGRRLVGDQDATARSRSPWRSSRAGASRRRTRAGTGRRAARGSGRRPARAARSRASARRRRSPSSCARARLPRSGCRPSGRGSATSSGPGRSSRCRRRARRAARFFDIVSRSRPLKIASPETTRPGGFGIRSSIVITETLLPGPGLADHAEDLAGEEVVVDAGDRLDDPVLGAELDRHVANRQDGLRHGASAASGRARRGGRRR